MEPTQLREAVRVLVLLWLVVSLVALTGLFLVHLIEQRGTGGARRRRRDSKH